MKELVKGRKLYFVFFLCAILLFSCGYGLDEVLSRRNPLYARTSEMHDLGKLDGELKLPTGKPYKVLVISDAHFGAETLPQNGPRKDEEFFAWFNQLKGEELPAFAVFLGDDAEHGKKEEFEAFRAFCRRIEERGLKCFFAVGNHDLFNQGFEQYREIVYPHTLFRFESGGFSYYFIDTASGFLGRRQMEILRKAFAKDKNPKIVASHFPIWSEGHFYFSLQDSSERNLLISYMGKDNVKACLTGHTHREAVSDFGPFTEYSYPGFFARSGWGVVTVDPASKTVRNEYFYLPCGAALCARFPARVLCRGCAPPVAP